MVRYIDGAIREAIGKGRALMIKIPGARTLGIHFASLANFANTEIGVIIDALDLLLVDSDYSDPKNLKSKFSKFKKLSGVLSSIENVVIAAMSRKTDDDDFVNKLVHEICKEINYPLPPPVASCLSQKYYHIYSDYGLICIPLLESEFVLHIPDLYHELGHPLIERDNPKIEAFKNNLAYFMLEVRKHFEDEIKRREINKLGISEKDPIYTYKDSWLEKWAEEFFCDLFATYTLGPAYLWSNLHMCVEMSWEVYKTPTQVITTHPASDARMRCCLLALEILGFKQEATDIREKWDEFVKIIGQKRTDDYSIAFPEKILKRAAEYCYIGIQQIGCQLATSSTNDKVNKLLNQAWKQFWIDPQNFINWERQAVIDFKRTL
ncbi:hypothetical protein [Spirosoma endophyticum]|uniref:Uncharacterized protein n=1 Tax=Spirosoma endophyticum TaxID=662367 RepID=A0A1I2BAQ6_9BACT|nr:hypothetical protein [Spirosoma endophyticum]SFE52978.1 hypothetical protein SAMN05216167_11538 [Spirosoma endophyticum]